MSNPDLRKKWNLARLTFNNNTETDPEHISNSEYPFHAAIDNRINSILGVRKKTFLDKQRSWWDQISNAVIPHDHPVEKLRNWYLFCLLTITIVIVPIGIILLCIILFFPDFPLGMKFLGVVNIGLLIGYQYVMMAMWIAHWRAIAHRNF